MATESFFSSASLALLASAAASKDGKAYSIKPNDGTGDFTFSRGSNLTATRVGVDGLIDKGRENLLKQSNNFDTTPWLNARSSNTSGQTGYDGSSDAWLFTDNIDSGTHLLYQNVSHSGIVTFSVYAKANTIDWLEIRSYSGGDTIGAYFDLANGVLGDALYRSAIDAKIEAVGNGWYKCSVTGNTNGTNTYVRIALADSDNGATYLGDGNGSIYIQDAQLEIGLAATDYIESGATTGKAGLLEDEPRFDYSGGATCPSLLLEPSRTNVWEYSEYLDYSFASVTGITTTQNTNETLSPEGLYNVTKLEGVGSWSLRDFIAGTDTGTWTISCYVKAVNASSNNTFRLSVGGNNFSSNLTATSEWQRFDFSVTDGGATAAGLLRDSSANDGDLYIYGLQVEAGSYPTSYIPNHSGGSVTRGADECTGAGDATTFNASEGVFYAEISTNTDFTDKAISLNNGVVGATNNRLWMGYSTTAKRVYTLGYVNNSVQFALSKLMTDESLFVKIACKYAENDVAFFVNGEKVATDTSAIAFTELTSMDFNIGNGTNASPLYGNAKQVLVFNEALSDEDCIALTTL